MAKTYYKSQPTAPQTQINWAEISSNVSGMLNEEVRVREEKRGAIDEAVELVLGLSDHTTLLVVRAVDLATDHVEFATGFGSARS